MPDEKIKVLVVDDEESVRTSLQLILESGGYPVSTVSSGGEAIDAVRQNGCDIVLTDIRMPGMDGIQVLEKVKSLDAGIEVIIVTAYASMDNALRAIKLGAFDYLQKPFTMEEVYRIIGRATEKRIRFLEERGIIRRAGRLEVSREALTEVNRLLDEKLYFLTVINKVDEVVAGVSRYEEVVRAVLGLISELIDFHLAGLYLVDHHEVILWLNHPLGGKAVSEFKVRLREALTGFAPPAGEIKEAMLQPENLVEPEGPGILSFYAVPLKVRNVFFGIFAVASADPNAFPEKARSTFSMIAHRSSLAIDNVMLYNRLQDSVAIKTLRLTAINRVGELIYSISDLDKLLVIFMELVLKTINAQHGSIMLLEKGNLVTRVDWELPADQIDTFRFADGERIPYRVLYEKKLVIIEDLAHDSRVISGEARRGAFLSIPLMTKDEVIGVLNILFSSPQKFNPDDIETLETVANLATTAIENAKLYEDSLRERHFEQELALARRIQMNLLPSTLPIGSDFHCGALSAPAQVIGGDYYDFFEIGEDKVGVVIADIVGKGIPAALVMTEIRSILRTYAASVNSPREALEKINQVTYRDPVVGKFVPLYYLVFNRDTREITYANAGHWPALLFRSRKKAVEVLDTEGIPIGGFLEGGYEEKKSRLDEGDILLLYTDGVVEAVNPRHERFGFEKLKGILTRLAEFDAQRVADRIYREVLEFAEGLPQGDDLTIVVLKAEAPTPDFLAKKSAGGVESVELRVSSDPRMVALVRARVHEIASRLGFLRSEIYDIKLAVNEAQANIIQHAYNGDPTRHIFFRFIIYKDKLEVFITNYGDTVDPATLKMPVDLEMLDGGGLGVFLIRTLMDEASYDVLPYVSTELRLVKYKKG